MSFLVNPNLDPRADSQIKDKDVDEAEDVEEERPDDAITCAFCDRPYARFPCPECHGRRWLSTEFISQRLGNNRVPCVRCMGEGQVDGFGPVSWSCLTCLGTGEMPVSALASMALGPMNIEDQDWSRTDLSGVDLSGFVFSSCDFSGVNFSDADLSDTYFNGCNFSGSNPERASSLRDAELYVAGLHEDQVAICIARGAYFDDVSEDIESP